MSNSNKKYWKGLEQLTNDPEFVKYADKEFSEYLPINKNKRDNDGTEEGSSRRDFLKMVGFSAAAASLAACEAPVRKAIPYLNKPEAVDPGVANYYASTYAQGGDYCSIVIKTREGRPIKIEGNKLSKVTRGGVSAQVEASVLSLYDQERLTAPYASGQKTDWESIDKEITNALRASKNIRIVSNTILSPSTKNVIKEFIAKYPNTKHVVYDPQSAYGIVKANQDTFGQGDLPAYDFSQAEVIVSLAADFLGTWISPITYINQYVQRRKLNKSQKEMSRHYQYESNMSLTGSNADYRIPVKPSQQGLIAATLYNNLAAKSGATSISTPPMDVPFLDKAADDLWSARGKSLVVSGSNDPDVQSMVNAINQLLGNYGTTIDLNKPVYHRQGNDQEMSQFIEDVAGGRIDAVIFYNANPVYDHPQGGLLEAELQKIALKISTSDRMDETASLSDFVAPDHHYLESWNDAQPQKDQISLCQPGITPLFNTRQAQSSFLTWAGADESDYHKFLQKNWQMSYFPGSGSDDFEQFWNQSLYDGVLELPVGASTSESTGSGDTEEAAIGSNGFTIDLNATSSALQSHYQTESTENELVLYQKVGVGTGAQANNPWLQELPDPITKAVWDNYLTVSQKFAREHGLSMVEGKTKMANLTVNGVTVSVPVLTQPGQAQGTIGLALGYGRKHAGRVADGLGANAFPLIDRSNGTLLYEVTNNVTLEVTDESHRIAQTQTHETFMGRESIIQEALLSEYQKDQHAGQFAPKVATWKGDQEKVVPKTVTLWKHHQDKYTNHHWGMSIDLNSCIGCGACTIACQAENNVPVVGREEVLNRREMHWIRIDRYYSSAGVEDYSSLEEAAENPEVTFQPMLCQHCNNAPCETVCPVSATTHSTEGLNQMAYNRCIGTRYCANNCPYKVRRFNWFKYHDNTRFPENSSMNNSLGRMVLNPDVTVRARGVMEKCTMCVQRIQAGKLVAKKEGRRPTDKDINTACASACPAEAIVFGDMNNPESNISKVLQLKYHEGKKTAEEPRAYTVLEELNVDPNIFYMRKIRNKDDNNA
ncbi:MAG: 4Fe-4S dicluster domain-containing protein [Bacteroidetes bacterium]|nr:MAG: 4Fe-4S dicluster domain-containing protein [Bacteroidota bacterium]